MRNLILFFALCGPAPAAVTLLTHTCVSGVNSGTSSAINTSGATFIALTYSWSTGTITPSDSQMNTQTALTPHTSNGSSQINYIANPSTSTMHTFSFSGTNVFAVVCIAAFSGIVTVNPFSTQNGNQILSATTLATNSATPPGIGSLLISGFHVENSTAAYSIDSSFNVTDQIAFSAGVNYGGALAYKITSDGAAENPVWSCNGTGGRLANTIATFQAVSSAVKHQSTQ